ncbi:MAG: sporulation protein YunB [Faecalibacillus sp.]
MLILLLAISIQIEPTIEIMAKKEMNQFLQLVINHVSFINNIDDQQLLNREYKDDKLISFQFNMFYLNKITGIYINRLEETLLQIEEGQYKNKDHSIYNKRLKKVSDNKGIIASIPIGALTNNVFFQNIGPSIHVKYKTLSLVSSQIDKKVENYGINHILVTIDLSITIKLQLIIPLHKTNYQKKFQIPLVFEIIEGEVPSWYQNQS